MVFVFPVKPTLRTFRPTRRAFGEEIGSLIHPSGGGRSFDATACRRGPTTTNEVDRQEFHREKPVWALIPLPQEACLISSVIQC